MKERPTAAEVFVKSVEDHLNGTPNAHHPVQFEDVVMQTRPPGCVRCTWCYSLVADSDEDRDGHRGYHDHLNKILYRIEAEARAYKSPPTYR